MYDKHKVLRVNRDPEITRIPAIRARVYALMGKRTEARAS
jgi:hypothetical protein